MSEDRSGKIGEMNGWWAFLVKFVLATYPMGAMWMVWVTVCIFSLQPYEPRYTHKDAEILRAELLIEMGQLPPPEWRKKIDEMAHNQQQILIRLERIQAELARESGP